jgi:hypothetical protein
MNGSGDLLLGSFLLRVVEFFQLAAEFNDVSLLFYKLGYKVG